MNKSTHSAQEPQFYTPVAMTREQFDALLQPKRVFLGGVPPEDYNALVDELDAVHKELAHVRAEAQEYHSAATFLSAQLVLSEKRLRQLKQRFHASLYGMGEERMMRFVLSLPQR